MTPEEFEENARIITGDPTWSLDNEETNCCVIEPSNDHKSDPIWVCRSHPKHTH